MTNSTMFNDLFLIDDKIQFWVAEDIGSNSSKPEIIGSIGLKYPSKTNKEYMKKMSMKNGLELKVRLFIN